MLLSTQFHTRIIWGDLKYADARVSYLEMFIFRLAGGQVSRRCTQV